MDSSIALLKKREPLIIITLLNFSLLVERAINPEPSRPLWQDAVLLTATGLLVLAIYDVVKKRGFGTSIKRIIHYKINPVTIELQQSQLIVRNHTSDFVWIEELYFTNEGGEIVPHSIFNSNDGIMHIPISPNGNVVVRFWNWDKSSNKMVRVFIRMNTGTLYKSNFAPKQPMK